MFFTGGGTTLSHVFWIGIIVLVALALLSYLSSRGKSGGSAAAAVNATVTARTREARQRNAPDPNRMPVDLPESQWRRWLDAHAGERDSLVLAGGTRRRVHF